MSEGQPKKEIVPVSRESVVTALRNWDENAMELLSQYEESLEKTDDGSTESRLKISEDVARIYMESKHFTEAAEIVENLLDVAYAEREEEAFAKFKLLGDEIVRLSSIDLVSPKPN